MPAPVLLSPETILLGESHMAGFSDLFAEHISKFTHLQFGEDRIEQASRLRSEFRIPEGEELLVFAPAENPAVFCPGVLITDNALYVHPQIVLSFHQNRIALSDLCQYLFFQEDSFDAVHAMSPKEDRVIFPKTSARRNETGRELLRLLKTFQENLMAVNPRLSRDYDKALASAIAAARSCFAEHGVLTVRAQMLLNLVENADRFPVDVTFLRAENLYRLSDMARYYVFLDEMTGKVNEDLIKRLKNPDEAFFPDFVRDISNPYSLFLTQDLLPAYANLRRLSALNEYQAVTLCYLCVRTDDDLYLHKLLTEYGATMGEKHLWEIMAFRARFKNEKMASIYNRILSDSAVSPTEQSWTDSLGFTTLHYAILLRNRKEVKHILESRDWSLYTPPEGGEMKTIFDFSFLASVVYENPQDVKEIFLHTSNLVKPILRAIASLDQKIYINQELGRADAVEEYRSKKRDMEKEIVTLCEAFIDRSRKKAAKLRESGTPFEKFLMGIYDNNDSLFSILTGTISDYRIYRRKNDFFVTTADTELPLSYYEWRDQSFFTKEVGPGEDSFCWTTEEEALYQRKFGSHQEERQERKYKKYSFTGDGAGEETVSYRDPQSWFSEIAHRDAEILKKEYRILVKKYHPDNSDIPQAKIILQQIMLERSSILQRLGVR